MGKGKRGTKAPSQLNTCYPVTKFGIPEVDRIFEGQKFRNQETSTCTSTDIVLSQNKEDRISELPDHILQFIISFLTMRQGAITSILARRWRNLWSTSLSCLDFNSSNIIGYNYHRSIFIFNIEDTWVHRTSHGRHFKMKKKGFLEKVRTKFVNRVNQLLQQPSASRLDALRVSFVLGKESSSHIDRWVEYAAARGITELKLDFNFLDFTMLEYDSMKPYTFPYWIFYQKLDSSSLKYLSLNSCIFKLPPDFKTFNSLVSLALRYINLSEVDVQNILSNCSSLESLSLIFCRFPRPRRNLKFSGPSLVLKHINCKICIGVNEIEVTDINILSFEFESDLWNTKLSIMNVPRLARLVLATYSPPDIMCEVPRLEILFLLPTYERKIWPKLFDLNNLKQLVVLITRGDKINLLEMVYLLEACPVLQKLTLDTGASIETAENLENIRTRPAVPNNNLKEVEIYGFEGLPTKIEFAKYLLKNATVLEKMKISTKRKVYCGNGIWKLYERMEQAGISLKKVRKLLHGKVRSSTELIIESYN